MGNFKKNHINSFFNERFGRWNHVYDENFCADFFSWEMRRRKNIILEVFEGLNLEKEDIAVLDCGCGPDGLLLELSKSNNKLFGIDINPEFLQKASNDKRIKSEFIQSDIERLPFSNEIFDVIICSGVFPYLESDDIAVIEIKRVLKKGGVVIVSNGNLFSLNKIFDPYFYLIGAISYLKRKRNSKKALINNEDAYFKGEMIRRYRLGSLEKKFKKIDICEIKRVSVSFSPFTFWKRNILPLSANIEISENLSKISARFSTCHLFANHWVVCLRRQ